jgi:broad specificity phosphatase PhoE
MIYFIRHGETDYNKQRRLQGHLDIPLNATGISQAEKARDELANIQFDVILKLCYESIEMASVEVTIIIY